MKKLPSTQADQDSPTDRSHDRHPLCRTDYVLYNRKKARLRGHCSKAVTVHLPQQGGALSSSPYALKERLLTQAETWTSLSEDRIDYHLRQYNIIYDSTRQMREWLVNLGLLTSGGPTPTRAVVDVGSGMGANLHYLASQHRDIIFQGWEINSDLVSEGNRALSRLGDKNASMHVVDLFSLPDGAPLPPGAIDGMVSFQVMSWLPDFVTGAQRMLSLRPRWWACSSLFYDGPISAQIMVTTPSGSFPYNIYSLDDVRTFFQASGYRTVLAKPFHISVDLARPEEPRLQTYTEQTADGRRLQISGPLLMPWYFVAAF